MDSPSSRKGALGDQKGPRMEEEVGSAPLSEACLWAISSTSLGFEKGSAKKYSGSSGIGRCLRL